MPEPPSIFVSRYPFIEVPEKITWSEEDDKKLFILFKKLGSKWSAIAKEFKNRTENQVKNRFYSTLRRIATKKRRENPNLHIPDPKSKSDLLQYVDDALEYGHNCCSKRGRMKKRLEPSSPNELPEFAPFSFPAKVALRVPQQQPQLLFPFMIPEAVPVVPFAVPFATAAPMAEYPIVRPTAATPEQLELAKHLLGPMQEHTGSSSMIESPPNLLGQMQYKLREVAALQQNIIDLLSIADAPQGAYVLPPPNSAAAAGTMFGPDPRHIQ